MTKQHYKTLGVEENASTEDIKKAYRRLAILHHPDKGGSKEEFSKISEAHEILSDPEKRQQYDMGIPQQGGMPFGFNPMNMFQNMFSQNHQPQHQRSADHQHQLNISLRDVYFGVKKSVKITITKFCFPCQTTCPECGGKGIRLLQQQIGPMTIMNQIPCNKCSGSGHVGTSSTNIDCLVCGGKETYKTEEICVLDIPKGVESGQRIVSKGLGEQPKTSKGEPGDLVFSVVVTHDPNFLREGNDLLYKANIPFKNTMTGLDMVIPHYDGNISINTLMFGIVNPMLRYSLPSKGICGESLVIVFVIDYSSLPKLTETQIGLLNEIFK